MSTPFPEWQFDESKPTGVNFSDTEVVAAYDAMHQKLRDYRQATAEILRRLALKPGSTVIDMGVGTGAFALHAASACDKIYAVDISPAMLAYTRQKAEQAGITNIEFREGGLLTYRHEEEPVDAMVCVAVLHHLPDFWKQIALNRCHQMLKPGGKLFLFDIVFPSNTPNLLGMAGVWIGGIHAKIGERLASEAVVHVRDEFSTFDWVMEGLLRRAGFLIDSAEYNGLQATYLCSTF